MRLRADEIREILSLLEEGKTLPDEYRFKLFDNNRKVELIWEGKTNEVFNVVLPFQTIERIDEPRLKGVKSDKQSDIFNFDVDHRGRQIKGWSNKLIWGDNKLILSSLKNGPLKEEIEKQGGIKLIYIDPPFDVGADFSMKIEIGEESITKKSNVLEEIAYRDTWGNGEDSFIAMIYERLTLMKDLLSDDGVIFIHCDWRVNSYIKLILDEIFGKENFLNEIIWNYKSGGISNNYFGRKHDTILLYRKSDNYTFNVLKEKSYNRGLKPYRFKNVKEYEDKIGWYTLVNMKDVWQVDMVGRTSNERVDYPTQKPEKLLERIIESSSNKNDLVADFFCGSGTTLAVAEKLGRKWIGSDLGKFAIHTTRKRMINIQRTLKDSGQDYRSFEILNLGKYERQHYMSINQNLEDKDQEKVLLKKEEEFISLILEAYKAQKIYNFKTIHGNKMGRFVSIGPIDLPVSRPLVEDVLNECIEKKLTKIDILGFEFEMGLAPDIQDYAKNQGIDLALKYIPKDVFDRRAIEKNQVEFYNVSYIEVNYTLLNNTISIELTDFAMFYNQDNHIAPPKNKSKLIIENGQLFRLKNDGGLMKRDQITNKWTDWIDYWSIDFDYNKEYDDTIFENEWQSFRTKQNRNLKLQSPPYKIKRGKTKIAIKIVDIFGNDTMKIIEVDNKGG